MGKRSWLLTLLLHIWRNSESLTYFLIYSSSSHTLTKMPINSTAYGIVNRNAVLKLPDAWEGSSISFPCLSFLKRKVLPSLAQAELWGNSTKCSDSNREFLESTTVDLWINPIAHRYAINKLCSSLILAIIHFITFPWRTRLPSSNNWNTILFSNPTSDTHLSIWPHWLESTLLCSPSFEIGYLCPCHSSLPDFSTTSDRILALS